MLSGFGIITLSSAFTASGILTLTLEFANSYQRQKDIDRAIKNIQEMADKTTKNMQEITTNALSKVQVATTDSIIRELVGDSAILNEIKTHIFKQSFVRKDFRIAINLQWNL